MKGNYHSCTKHWKESKWKLRSKFGHFYLKIYDPVLFVGLFQAFLVLLGSQKIDRQEGED